MMLDIFNFTIPGYRPIEQLHQGATTLVYRAVSIDRQSQPVIIKVLTCDYPTQRDLLQFRHQYTIAKQIDLPGVIRPYQLLEYRRGYALVMEDYGGISLNQYQARHSLTVTDILSISIQLADILHALYQQRIVHKDIKPANILIHPESKQIKLIDFGIASLLPRETQEILSPNLLEGTLAYISPEQTGRMNRGIDYRTDFYSLGVTLYQLLTGKLPFETGDPIESIHCHLAQVPIPVDRVNPDVPAAIAASLPN
jgi:serine/threonine protein kinase